MAYRASLAFIFTSQSNLFTHSILLDSPSYFNKLANEDFFTMTHPNFTKTDEVMNSCDEMQAAIRHYLFDAIAILFYK